MRTRSRRSSPDSRHQRTLLVIVVTAWLLAAASPARPLENPPPRDAAPQLARELLSTDSYQTELPPTLATLQTDLPGWLSFLAPLGSLTALLLYALAIGVVVLLLVWAGQAFVRHADTRTRRSVNPAVEGSSITREDLPDPGVMAERGLYKEAIHGLLLLAIRKVARNESMVPARSWTSRELAWRLPMSDRARRAFRKLVTAVEGSHFGDIAVGQEHYRLCLRHYRIATGEVAE